jgi:hypothetical protein
MTARAEHLAAQELARRQGQRIILQRDLLDTLRRRELDAVGAQLSAETGLAFTHPAAGEHVAGTHRQRLTLTSGRFAMIDNGLGFQLVPWVPSLEKHLGRHVAGVAKDIPIQVQRVPVPGSNEIELYCHSSARAEKDVAIDTKMALAFETALQKLVEGIGKARATKDPGKIRERIGRAKEKYARVAQHYTVELTTDKPGKTVTAITWSKTPKPNAAMANPGVYCLRTTLTEPDNQILWQTYAMLTNLEAVFRSLKTDLGLRPVDHQIERRVEGHLFISVIAYYVVHTIRRHLKAHAITDSWDTIRNTLAGQVRITATLQRSDGRTAHVRKASRPDPHQQKLYDALKLKGNPGGTQQTIV